MLEKFVEKYLVEQIKSLGGVALKLIIQNGKFYPDRTIFIKGKIFLVEIKTEKGKLSLGQQIKFRKFKKLGFEVYVLYSKIDVDNFISNIILPICKSE